MFSDIKNKIPTFLSHVFIKRQQSTYFEKVKSTLDNETLCLQVDFSENFKMDIQDAIQNSYYSKNSVSLFTSYVWYSNGGQSFVYVSNNLTHDKFCISTILDHLFFKLKTQFQNLKQIHIFSDGAAQQFKQRFLFRNLCRLAEQFQVHSHVAFLSKFYFVSLGRFV